MQTKAEDGLFFYHFFFVKKENNILLLSCCRENICDICIKYC